MVPLQKKRPKLIKSFFVIFAFQMQQIENVQKYRVMALDDHPVVLEGVKHLLVSTAKDVECHGVTSHHDLMALLEKGYKYELFILDLELPDSKGFEIIATIDHYCPEAAKLVYTMHEEPWIIARLAGQNIQGFVSKDSEVEKLLEAVNTIRQGGVSYNATFLQYAIVNGTEGHARVELSEREQQVLDYISKGMNTQQIANKLFISPNTVGTYRRRLMSKFDAHNVAQLLARSGRQSIR